jgi:hypothetical protein
MGYALIFLGRYDDAIPWLQRSLAVHPSNTAHNRGNAYAAIAAAHAFADRLDEARSSATEARRLWPTLTVRGFHQVIVTHPSAVEQVSRLRDGLRVAGIRDHADEDVDWGLTTDDTLHADYEARTPSTVPGAQTIRTPDLIGLLDQRKPLVLDAGLPWGRSIPGAVGLRGAGIAGSLSDEYQDRLRQKLQQLIGGDLAAPIVTMGWNAERFQGRNLALRLAALGRTEVYWYRGGREAWEVAGLPETEVDVQDW